MNQYSSEKKPCRWMEAGVIDFKFCEYDFDCTICDFDKVMSKTASETLARRRADGQLDAKKGPGENWEEKMYQHFGKQQKCELMETRNCYHCSYDELLEEQFDIFLAPERPKLQEVYGITVPISSFLHRGHTWAALENAGRIRVGLDDFSQKVLGPFDKIRLPDPGEEIHANEVALALFRGGKKAAVLAPMDGVIDQVNPKVRQDPGVVRKDPYGEGWLFLVTPTNLKPNLERMLFGQCNVAWIGNELLKLQKMLESSTGITLPSGGAIIGDVYGQYPQLKWKRLVQEFLHTP